MTGIGPERLDPAAERARAVVTLMIAGDYATATILVDADEDPPALAAALAIHTLAIVHRLAAEVDLAPADVWRRYSVTAARFDADGDGGLTG